MRGMVLGMTRVSMALSCFVACALVRPPASNDVTLVLHLPEGAPDTPLIAFLVDQLVKEESVRR